MDSLNYSDSMDYDYYETCESALPQEMKSTFTIISQIFYCLTFIIGFPGNALVIWIAGVKMKRTVNTVWFLNLAIADLLCCLSIPFTVAEIQLDHHWPYGDAMCKVIPCTIILNMFASVFTLNCISLDRFVQVVKPVWAQNNRTLRLAWACCAVAWALAMLLSLPNVILRETFTDEDFNKTFCTFWSGNSSDTGCGFENDRLYEALTVTRFLVGFLIPLVSIVWCYTLIARRVSKSQFQAGRAFRIMMTVIMAFFLSWLPYHVIGLAFVYGGEWTSSLAQDLDPLVIALAYFNSCINPVLYVFMGQDFKEKVKLSLGRIFEKAFTEDTKHSSLNSKGPTSAITETSDTQL